SIKMTVPAAEGDLWNGPGASPLPNPYGRGLTATITLTAQGTVVSNTTYVVIQTRNSPSDAWVDCGWIKWTGNGTSTWLVSIPAQDVTNVFNQTRTTGQDPGASGTNAVTLGGQVRVVGKATLSGSAGSSSSSGVPGAGLAILADVSLAIHGAR